MAAVVGPVQQLPRHPPGPGCAFAVGSTWVLAPLASAIPDANPGRVQPGFEFVSCALPAAAAAVMR